jgi:endonuclease G
MTYLTTPERNQLSDAIINTVGYTPAIRKIFLADINSKFRSRLSSDVNEQTQLDLDLVELNKTERLVDGTIPFQSWLQTAARYLQPYPAEIKIVQEAQAAIEGKSTKAAPIANTAAPSLVAANNIVKEKIIHQNDMVEFSFLEAGFKAGVGVARLLVPRFDNGAPIQGAGGAQSLFGGTGWMLTNQLIITNHHVINARSDNEPDASDGDFNLQGSKTIVEFDYNIDEVDGIRFPSVKLEAADQQLDYAIIRLKEPVKDRMRPARFAQEIFVTENNPQPVNIIQHPFGHAKKIAFRNNHIFESKFPTVRYFTDTEKGSSGSPVFNDKWQVVALHRASQLVENVTYQGKSTGWINEGIQLKAIFDHLSANFKALSIEISNG